jgi:lathosterol oxidase
MTQHTPFAALAFTPMDGFSQSLPYHMFVFTIPMHKLTYILSFVAIQLWTVFIHDHFYVVPEWLDDYVNGSKHHTDRKCS